MLLNPDSDTFYVGGMDISFVKGDDVNACAALVVYSFPDLEVKLSIYKTSVIFVPTYYIIYIFKCTPYSEDLTVY